MVISFVVNLLLVAIGLINHVSSQFGTSKRVRKMRCNMATWDKTLRLLVGTLLTGWGIAGGPVWAYVGIILIATAAWRFCPLYALFKIGTDRREH